MSNTIKVSILGEVKDLNRKLGQVQGNLEGFGKKVSRIGGLVAGAFAGGAIVKGVKDVVSSASDAQQSIGATQTVFGKYSKQVIKDSNAAAKQFGLDANTYRENTNLIGALFSNQGVAANKLAGATKQVVGVGADLAATFGGTTTDAVNALGAAYKGEFDSLEKYGISLKESTIQAELAARGQDKLTGAALAAAKQQVTTDLIMKQTSKTRGAFKKENNTLAHQQQVLAAQFENVKAKIGTALLPVMTKFVGFLNSSVIPKLEEWWGIFKDKVIPVIKDLATWVQDTLLPPLKTLGDWMMDNKTVVATFAGVILTIVAAVKIWTAVQAAFNAVLAMNPIGLVVIAIAALVAAMVYAYKKSETFRNIVNGAFDAIKGVVSAVMPVIKNIIQTVWGGIQSYIKGVMNVIKGVIKVVTSAIKGDWKGVWDGIKQIFTGVWQQIKGIVTVATAVLKNVLSAAWDAIKSKVTTAWNNIKTSVSNGINKVVEYARGLPGKITGALGNLGDLLKDAGKQIMQGLLDGITSMWGSVTGKFKALTDKIPDWKGPAGKDRRLLKNAGRLIMAGLVDGIDEGAKGVQDKLGDVTKIIETYYDKAHPKNKGKAAFLAKYAVKSLKDEGQALKRNARLQKANNDALKEASKTLEDAIKKRDDYAASVTNAAVAIGALTNLGKREGPEGTTGVTSADMVADLKVKVAEAHEFAALIQDLTAKGLNQTNLDQLIQAGVDGGLATARALAMGGPQAVTEINSLTAQLQAVAQSMGTSTAETMHGAGVQAAQGLVDGFESMADRLEKAGNRLARKMIKAIKKALKIKSPSRVFKRIGEQTTEGIVVGLKDTRGVERATVNVAKAMTNSFGQPNLHTNANLNNRRTGDVVNINVTAPATVDKAALGKEITSAVDAYYRSGGRRTA